MTMATHIPDGIAKRHIAILGTNGSGKTSAAKQAIVEPALIAGLRVCAIDPTGVWWGLRLGANGKPKDGFKVYIVGGEHGDFKLAARDGKVWAEIVGTSGDSFVFDTSQMTVTDRTVWFTGFAEALILKNKGPLHLALDEAHLFAPQGGARAGGLAPDMLHATNNLLALGRSKGLRVTMISQRPAKLHKDSLTQAHTLFAMKLIAPQDRNAVKEWIADQTDPESGNDLIASLPTLKAGEGWVWSPADAFLKRVIFPLPRTFDSSRAPEDGEGTGPALPAIDPAAVEERLKAVAADAVANDPKALKAEIASLRRQMSEAARVASATGTAIDPKALEDAEARGYHRGTAEGQHAAIEAMLKEQNAFVEQMRAALNTAMDALGAFTAKPLPVPDLTRKMTVVDRRSPPPVRPAPKAAPINAAPSGDHSLEGPQRRLLTALAWWKRMGHDKPSRAQVAGIAGWKITSGHLKNVVGSLKTAGLVDYPDAGRVMLTEAGEAAAPEPDMSVSLHDGIRSALDGPQVKIFETLLDRGELDRTEVAAACGWEPTSGHLKNVIGSLRTLEIVAYPSSGRVALQDWVIS